MIRGFVLLLIFGVALCRATDEQVSVASATARTVYSSNHEPKKVLDDKTDTFYHSDGKVDQWLRLELTKPQDVGKVIIINRYYTTNYITMKH